MAKIVPVQKAFACRCASRHTGLEPIDFDKDALDSASLCERRPEHEIALRWSGTINREAKRTGLETAAFGSGVKRSRDHMMKRPAAANKQSIYTAVPREKFDFRIKVGNGQRRLNRTHQLGGAC